MKSIFKPLAFIAVCLIIVLFFSYTAKNFLSQTSKPSPSPQSTQLAQIASIGQTGIVGAWSFDAGEGSTATNLVGTYGSGTTNGAGWTTGKFGNATLLNGTSNFISIAPSTIFDNIVGAQPYTLEAWIYLNNCPTNTAENYPGIIEKSSTAGEGGWGLQLTPACKVNFGLHGSGNFSSIITLVPGQWYHIAGVWSSSATNNSKIYINGNLDSSGTIANTWSHTANIKIGNKGASYLSGKIDEVRVYNRALSLAEIQTDMNTPIQMSGTNPPVNPPANPAPVTTLSASPSTITSGNSATLTWSSTNATSCTASGGWAGARATSGTSSFSPTSNTTYTLACAGAGGTDSKSVTVTVSTTTVVPLPPSSGFPTPDIVNNASFENGATGGFGGITGHISFDSTHTYTGTSAIKRILARNTWPISSIAAGSPAIVYSPGFNLQANNSNPTGRVGILGTNSSIDADYYTNNTGVRFVVQTSPDHYAIYTDAAHTIPFNLTSNASGGTMDVGDQGSNFQVTWANYQNNYAGAKDRVWAKFYFYFDTAITGPFKFQLWNDSLSGNTQMGGWYVISSGVQPHLMWSFGPEGDTVDFSQIPLSTLTNGWHSLEVDYWRNGDISNGGNDYPSAAFWLDDVPLTSGGRGNYIGYPATGSWINGRFNAGRRVVHTQTINGITSVVGSEKLGYYQLAGIFNHGQQLGGNLWIDNVSVSSLGRIPPISGSPATPTPDTTAPSVSLTAPSAGSVSGAITVSATASDNVGVAGVQFLLDGVNLGAEDTSSPYSISWNTTSATNASHTIIARARDAAGNTTTSGSVSVTVNNAVVTPPPSSTKFQTNDRVQVTGAEVLNVRATPSATGSVLGTQAGGNLGTITSQSTVFAGSFNWWNVNFDTGVGGWSAENFLTKYTAPVVNPNPAPVTTLSASPSTITSGNSATLTWSSTNATSCTASGGWAGARATSGTSSFSPTSNTTYTLACAGAGGTDSKSVTVTVSTTTVVPLPPSSGFPTPDILNDASFEAGFDGWTTGGLGQLPSSSRVTGEHAYNASTGLDDPTQWALKGVMGRNIWTITDISVGNPTIVTAPGHGFSTGDVPGIGGTNSIPSIDQVFADVNRGSKPITVIDANRFSLPINVTGQGTTGTAKKDTGGLNGFYAWSRKGLPELDRVWYKFYFYLTNTFDGPGNKFTRHLDNSFNNYGGGFGIGQSLGFAFQPESATDGTYHFNFVPTSQLVGGWHSIEIDEWRNGDTSNGGNDYPSYAFWLDGTPITPGGLRPPFSVINGRVNAGQRNPLWAGRKLGMIELNGTWNGGNTIPANFYFDHFSISSLGRIPQTPTPTPTTPTVSAPNLSTGGGAGSAGGGGATTGATTGTVRTSTTGSLVSTSTTAPLFTRLMYMGTRGSDVQVLQQKLQTLGHLSKTVQTVPYFGLLTEQAVKDFQVKYNIVTAGAPITTGFGALGPRTRAKLNEILGFVTTTTPTIQQLQAQIDALVLLIKQRQMLLNSGH